MGASPRMQLARGETEGEGVPHRWGELHKLRPRGAYPP
jgi:hypothetical protein